MNFKLYYMIKIITKTITNFFLFLVLFGCKNATIDKKEENNEAKKEQVVQKNDKPNIIYIMADDLGYGDVGVYGQQKIKTPNIDKMAAEGIRFTDHYAGSTVCMPSRAALLTGRHMGHNTVRGNPRWAVDSKPVDLKPEEITVAEELKRAGYNTAVIGKWGLAESGMQSMPNPQGFDYFYGYRTHKEAHHYYPDVLWHNNDSLNTGNITYEKKGTYSQDTFMKKALQYVNDKKDEPFFLYLAFIIPHYELTIPEEQKAYYKSLDWKKRVMKSTPGKGYQHDEEGHTTYASMVSRMDGDIGKLMEELKKIGIDDNTLIVFTSDNGHEFDRNFFDSNGRFRGKKRDLYEGGIRIPFIARWPGTIKAGSVTNHPSAFWDFLPTACEIAGITPTDTNIDGISYLPTLLGKEENQKKHDYLYWEFNEKKGPVQAIRKGNWKAVKFLNKPMELFDLSTDLEEKNDIASSNQEMVSEMTQLFKDARIDSEKFPLEFHSRIKKSK